MSLTRGQLFVAADYGYCYVTNYEDLGQLGQDEPAPIQTSNGSNIIPRLVLA